MGQSVYRYVGGNPASYVDFDGLTRRGGPTRGRPNQTLSEMYHGPVLRSEPTASSPVGRSGEPIAVLPGSNLPGQVYGRPMSGHAYDRMQERGIFPSVVENAIRNGQRYPGGSINEVQYHDTVNNITVIMNPVTGNVITVRPGPPAVMCP